MGTDTSLRMHEHICTGTLTTDGMLRNRFSQAEVSAIEERCPEVDMRVYSKAVEIGKKQHAHMSPHTCTRVRMYYPPLSIYMSVHRHTSICTPVYVYAS